MGWRSKLVRFLQLTREELEGVLTQELVDDEKGPEEDRQTDGEESS